ncbi:anthranilate phosphoribosyltransferase [Thecaphora frezii]
MTPPASSDAPVHTAETFRPLVKALGQAASVDPHDPFALPTPRTTPLLSTSELESLFQHLADLNFTSSREHHAQIGSALTSLQFTRLDIQASTFALAARIFLDSCLKVDVKPLHPSLLQLQPEDGEKPKYEGTLDLVGTGGDGKDTFNVSTTAAMVAAGVPGVRVCKHGAKASSSTSGSADLLNSLGVPLLTLPPSQMPELLPRSRFSFLFAQLYHPALAPLGPIRRNLGFRTIFNHLGPLINPAKPQRGVYGVHSFYLGRIFAEALVSTGVERSWVVCGKEGLDEISPEGETDVWEIHNSQIRHFSLSPRDFGLASHPLAHVGSHSSQENAAIVLHLFSCGSLSSLPSAPLSSPLPLDPSAFEEPSTVQLVPHLPSVPAGTRLSALADYTLLQSAALLYVGEFAESLPAAVELARTSIESGQALKALETFRVQAEEAVKREEQLVKDEEDEQKKRHRRSSLDMAARDRSKQDQYSYFPETYQDAAVGTQD